MCTYLYYLHIYHHSPRRIYIPLANLRFAFGSDFSLQVHLLSSDIIDFTESVMEMDGTAWY